MARESGTAAPADAGIAYSEVQQAYVGYVYGESTSGQRALYELDMTDIPIVNVNNNCSTGSTAMFLAAQAIRGGLADCTLALGFEKMQPGSLGTVWDDREQPLANHLQALAEISEVLFPPAPWMFGAAGREHMVEHGTTAEHFAKIGLKNHRHSVDNPNSQFQDEYTDAFGGMKTHVRRDGDDYLLNGQETFITNGPYADLLVVYAKLDEADGADRRDRKVLTFVLDKGMEGLTQSAPMRTMGMHSSPTGELFFNDVRLTPDRLLGETEDHRGGDGRDSARSSFVIERVGCAILSLGIINECHRLCVEYATTRQLWGRDIGRFQLIQLKLARMEVARINVQNMVFSALEQLSDGAIPTLAEASAMKLYSTEAATDVAMDAVQLFGGNGYMSEYRVKQLARDAKSLMIYAGSNEIQVTHVAKGLLNY